MSDPKEKQYHLLMTQLENMSNIIMPEVRNQLDKVLTMNNVNLSTDVAPLYLEILKHYEMSRFIAIQSRRPYSADNLNWTEKQQSDIYNCQRSLNDALALLESHWPVLKSHSLSHAVNLPASLDTLYSPSRAVDNALRHLRNDFSISREEDALHSFSYSPTSISTRITGSAVSSPGGNGGIIQMGRQNAWWRAYEFVQDQGKLGKMEVGTKGAQFSEISPREDQVFVENQMQDRVKSSSLQNITIQTQNLNISMKHDQAPVFSAGLPGYFSPALLNHSPTRFTSVHRALITTDARGIILIANDVAGYFLGTNSVKLIGKCLFDWFTEKYQQKYSKLLLYRREKSVAGNVLASGKIMRLQVLDSSNNERREIAASLWLKENIESNTTSISENQNHYLWVMESVQQHSLTITISRDNGLLVPDLISLDTKRQLEEFFGCHFENGNWTLADLIPAIRAHSSPRCPTPSGLPPSKASSAVQKLNIGALVHPKYISMLREAKYFGGMQSNGERFFPLVVRVIETDSSEPTLTLTMITMPHIAGLLTVNQTGLIQSCNSKFTKFLFGFPASELIGKWNVSALLPSFFELLDATYGPASENTLHILQSTQGTPTPSPSTPRPTLNQSKTITFTNGASSNVTAYHRDGTPLHVDVQIRAVHQTSELIYALWLSYHDENATEPNETDANLKQEKTESITPDALQLLDSPKRSSLQEKQAVPQYSRDNFPCKSVSIKDYLIIDSLGEGAFGFVKLAAPRTDPTKRVVLKHIIKSRISMDSWVRDNDLGLVPVELHILHTLAKQEPRHTNVVVAERYWEDMDYFYVEMALHGYGLDLFDYIELHSHMSELEAKYLFKQAVSAVAHLHSKNIVHRDIKDENLILDQYGVVKLIDFGSAEYVRPGKRFDTFCGTMDYAAPEVLMGHTYMGPPQDVYALGILLYTLIYKENPYYNIDEILTRELRWPFVLSDSSVNLIKWMLNRSPDLRPTIEQVAQHEWLTTPCAGDAALFDKAAKASKARAVAKGIALIE